MFYVQNDVKHVMLKVINPFVEAVLMDITLMARNVANVIHHAQHVMTKMIVIHVKQVIILTKYTHTHSHTEENVDHVMNEFQIV